MSLLFKKLGTVFLMTLRYYFFTLISVLVAIVNVVLLMIIFFMAMYLIQNKIFNIFNYSFFVFMAALVMSVVLLQRWIMRETFAYHYTHLKCLHPENITYANALMMLVFLVAGEFLGYEILTFFCPNFKAMSLWELSLATVLELTRKMLWIFGVICLYEKRLGLTWRIANVKITDESR